MRIATPDNCVFGNTPELPLILHKYSVNIAIFEVDPDNSHEYVLNSSIVVDPSNHDNFIYLLKDGNHYQQIITLDDHYFIGATSTFPPINDIKQHQELPTYVPYHYHESRTSLVTLLWMSSTNKTLWVSLMIIICPHFGTYVCHLL